MSTRTLVESLLRQGAALLREHNETNWADALENLAAEYPESPEATTAKIRAMYGGMGSFNDVILYGANGHPLRSENDELDGLRSRLFAACRH